MVTINLENFFTQGEDVTLNSLSLEVLFVGLTFNSRVPLSVHELATFVVNFDQHLGSAHSNCWLKFPLSTSSLIWPSYTLRATIIEKVFRLESFTKSEYFPTKRNNINY